ncbi:Nephrocystin-3 [Arthrobotrys entomopaga]|nr:Nephrocystin-3 [Arthrobotrys entomopaga]
MLTSSKLEPASTTTTSPQNENRSRPTTPLKGIHLHHGLFQEGTTTGWQPENLTGDTDELFYQCEECDRIYLGQYGAEEHALETDHISFTKLTDEAATSPTETRDSNTIPTHVKTAQDTLRRQYPSTLSCLLPISSILTQQQEYETEQTTLERRYTHLRTQLGENAPETLHVLHDYATVLHAQGDNRLAETSFRTALERREKVLGYEDLDTLKTLDGLATLLNGTDRYEEAIEKHEIVVRVLEKIYGTEDPNTIDPINSLALGCQKCAQFARAEVLFRRALDRSERVLGYQHPTTLRQLENLAGCISQFGDYVEAEKLYRRALTAREEIFGDRHADTIQCIYQLAKILYLQERYDEAESNFQRALGLKQTVTLVDVMTETSDIWQRGTKYRREQKYWASEEMQRRVLDRIEKGYNVYPDEDVSIIGLTNLGNALEGQCRFNEAVFYMKQAVEMAERIIGYDHPDTMGIVHNLGAVYKGQRELDLAETCARRAMEGHEKSLGPNHPKVLFGMLHLATFMYERIKPKLARKVVEDALGRIKKILGDPRTEYHTAKEMRAVEEEFKKLEEEVDTHAILKKDAEGESSSSPAIEIQSSYSDTDPWMGKPTPLGYKCLNHFIEKTRVEILNAHTDSGTIQDLLSPSIPAALRGPKTSSKKMKAGTEDFITSDVDEQLMIHMRFQQPIKIFAIQLTSFLCTNDEEEVSKKPRTVQLYVNRPQILGFEERAPFAQKVEIAEGEWDAETGTVMFNTQFVKFQNVSTLTIFIVDGLDEDTDDDEQGEFTRIDRIRIIGK